MRLGTKIAVIMSTLITVVLAVLGALEVARDQTFFEADATRDQLTVADVLASSAELELQNGASDARIDSLVRGATERESQLRAVWGWLDGPLPSGQPEMPRRAAERLASSGSTTFRIGPSRAEQWTAVAGRGPNGRPFLIAVGEDLAPERAHLLSSIARTGFEIAILGVLCSAATVLIGLRFIASPVKKLVEHARAVASGDLSRRLLIRQGDEIGALASEMNSMTAELAASRELLNRETEKRLATVEQLRHADRLTTVGKLASGLAHELGTPLNVAHGYARLISTSSGSDEIKSHAETIVGQIDRMTRLVRQLLDFARRKGPQRTPTDVATLARKVSQVLAPTAQKKHIEIITRAPGKAIVDADPTMIEQVVTNLMFNAIQASPDHAGPVTVAVEAAQVDSPPRGRPSGAYTLLSVEDHGSGIAPENLDRVFEPFFTTKEIGEGTGLGLSVSYGIIEDHGGFIDVESEVGRGTTFRVFLPGRALGPTIEPGSTSPAMLRQESRTTA